ncbi:protein rtoA-like [Anneissia japonica]|uniref:protein rtoA-like n=1 Tax=Anneissia japonica TaxID=1529436 RepID=UPI0014258A63|nr:protein rtoA-like [Anneissia japonica]XP_033116835.1 protein rtoA-like [Anneissia japonica]
MKCSVSVIVFLYCIVLCVADPESCQIKKSNETNKRFVELRNGITNISFDVVTKHMILRLSKDEDVQQHDISITFKKDYVSVGSNISETRRVNGSVYVDRGFQVRIALNDQTLRIGHNNNFSFLIFNLHEHNKHPKYLWFDELESRVQKCLLHYIKESDSSSTSGTNTDPDSTTNSDSSSNRNQDSRSNSGRATNINLDSTTSSGSGSNSNPDSTSDLGSRSNSNPDSTSNSGSGSNSNPDSTTDSGSDSNSNQDSTTNSRSGSNSNPSSSRSDYPGGEITNEEVPSNCSCTEIPCTCPSHEVGCALVTCNCTSNIGEPFTVYNCDCVPRECLSDGNRYGDSTVDDGDGKGRNTTNGNSGAWNDGTHGYSDQNGGNANGYQGSENGGMYYNGTENSEEELGRIGNGVTGIGNVRAVKGDNISKSTTESDANIETETITARTARLSPMLILLMALTAAAVLVSVIGGCCCLAGILMPTNRIVPEQVSPLKA